MSQLISGDRTNQCLYQRRELQTYRFLSIKLKIF